MINNKQDLQRKIDLLFNQFKNNSNSDKQIDVDRMSERITRDLIVKLQNKFDSSINPPFKQLINSNKQEEQERTVKFKNKENQRTIDTNLSENVSNKLIDIEKHLKKQ